MVSSTDQNGDITLYYYDTTTGDLLYHVNPDYASGLYYEYDDIGRLIHVYPISYLGSVNAFLPESGLEFVEYNYNSLQQLSGINTDTTGYTFTYDEFGNTTSISAGDYTLATYTYGENNGKMLTMTYGNGTTVSYTYDTLDRIEKISYNGTVRYEYQYTAEGQLHSVSDSVNGIGYLYEYDGEDRLVGYVEYDLNDKTSTLGILYTYDEQSRLFDATTTIDYSLSSDTATQELYEQYLYDYKTNMLSDYTVIFGHGVYDGYNISADFTYDGVRRANKKTYTLTTSGALTNTIEFTYADRANGDLLSSFVNTYSTQMGTSTATTYTYTYDDNGNITKIVDNAGKTTKYTYDDLGQLIREDNPYKNASYTYTYDNNGNRTSKKTYAYTTGNLGTASSTTNYTYGDSTWGDRLTNAGTGTITYDAIGNPIIYFSGNNYIFTWTDGRRLATAETQDGYYYSFTYNDEGIRTSKTVDGVKHNYTLEGTRIISEQWDNKFIIYLYDEVGSPIGMLYRTKTYAKDLYTIFYFEKNLQGDIIAVYNAGGTKLASYTYDAWGNCTTTYFNSGSSTAAQYNPFRYRGYYYDADLGLYYLNSRYYDPNTGRFLNADGLLNASLIGYNQYSYCENNPIARMDCDGDMWQYVPALNPANMVYGGGGSGGFGFHPGSYHSSYDSSAYSTYKISTNVASYDATLVGYYYGGGSYMGGFTAQFAVGGNVSVTDSMSVSTGGQGYKTFKAFKAANGNAGQGKHWHHIVEQNQIERSGFSPYSIHNTNNLIPIDAGVHSKITAYYNSKLSFTEGLTVRDWLTGKSFQYQYIFGWDVINRMGG